MTEFKLHNLFFALWPDRSVRTELVHLQQVACGNAARIQHPEDLHMTLVFLGKVAPERIDSVVQAATGFAARPFTMELNRTGYWKRSRIRWCSPDQTPEQLGRLVLDLQLALVPCGFRPEERVYRPHVTLARKAEPSEAATLDSPIIWRPREFVLAGSHSGPEAPRYVILKSWSI